MRKQFVASRTQSAVLGKKQEYMIVLLPIAKEGKNMKRTKEFSLTDLLSDEVCLVEKSTV